MRLQISGPIGAQVPVCEVIGVRTYAFPAPLDIQYPGPVQLVTSTQVAFMYIDVIGP
jgi:hypothetical protein